MPTPEQIEIARKVLQPSYGDFPPLRGGEAVLFAENMDLWRSIEVEKPERTDEKCEGNEAVKSALSDFPRWPGELEADRDANEFSLEIFRDSSSRSEKLDF
jgi:hypothetical protein